MTATEKFYATIEAQSEILKMLTRRIKDTQIEYCKYLANEVELDAITKNIVAFNNAECDINTVYEVIKTLDEQYMKLEQMLFDFR